MKATVEKLDNNEVILEIEVEASKVQKAINQAYSRLAKQVNIPGFRKGKVPRFILERHISKEHIYNEVAENVIPPAYEEAIVKNKVEPINRPEIEILKIEEGQPLSFKAKVEVKPEIDLSKVKYTGVEVECPEVNVTEEDIDAYLKDLQQRYAELKVIEDEPAKVGDILTIDFKGTVDGKAYPGMEGENYPLELGSDTFIPNFGEQLVGAKADEERTVIVTFPTDYHEKELAGKEAVFEVKIHNIKRKELAPLDDEFAKDVSECETLEELRKDIRSRLEERQKNEINSARREKVVDKIVETAEVEVPEVMVERQIESRLRQLENTLRAQRLDIDKFLEKTGKSMEELKNDFRPQAEKDIKTQLILEAIAKAENIEVTQEDLDKEIANMAKMLNQDTDEIRKNLGDLSYFKYDIMIKKTIDFLVDASVAIPPCENEEKDEKKKDA
ncbi:MAG: trigger factor [Clostridia bacterium]|nr:trigger factor [Clostridia bacterium]